MKDISQTMSAFDFTDLEVRFGRDNAFAILRALEEFEGVRAFRVSKLSFEDRLKNVFRLMTDNLNLQTRH